MIVIEVDAESAAQGELMAATLPMWLPAMSSRPEVAAILGALPVSQDDLIALLQRMSAASEVRLTVDGACELRVVRV